MTAALATAWTLIVLLGLVSYIGLWRLDRKRAGGGNRGRGRPRVLLPAGRRSETSTRPAEHPSRRSHLT